MSATLLDHALALMFAVGFPVVAVPLYARRRPRLLAGDHAVRIREYRETVMWLAGMGIATLVAWLAAARPLVALGLGFPVGGWAIAALASAIVVAALLALQVRAIRRNARVQQTVRAGLEPVKEYLPTNREQLRWFRAVSFSAGIGEELFYRGFLLWYLALYVSLPAAVAASSILFGVAHLMHGAAATIRATLMGGVLAVLYIVSGALWASMLLHTAIDLSSGAAGHAVFSSDESLQRASR